MRQDIVEDGEREEEKVKKGLVYIKKKEEH